MHAKLVMRDGAWPAGYNFDEDILLYKTSGSNLARDFPPTDNCRDGARGTVDMMAI